MELTGSQKDALTELINIGYGRAAGALSELTGYRVTLEVPRISMHRIEQIAALIRRSIQGEVASVNQQFSGTISGNALLMLDSEAARVLGRLLCDDLASSAAFDSASREIITEVGNILLNACLGVFGNLLQVQINFAVPHLMIADIAAIGDSIENGSDELQYGLMVHTRFQLRASNVTGYMVIVLGIASVERMCRELDSWEVRQTG
jgi:chemotaxis protein CheC